MEAEKPSKLDAEYSSQPRETWYSSVADAYDRLRPRYPDALIDRAIAVAQLPANATLLEIGCGPGTATTAFAQRGCSIVGLEPSSEACELARQNCAAYPNVEIVNTTFEAWELKPGRFDAVLAATSFHWVAPEVGYSKAAEALKNEGSLILLWNMTLQPNDEIYQAVQPIYQAQAPALIRYESRENQTAQLQKLEQGVINSVQFQNLVSEAIACEVTYSVEDYLALLSTYSPYIALDPQTRSNLFAELRSALNSWDALSLSYLSAFQIAQRRSSFGQNLA